jgi:hypothetical protein
MKIRTVLATAVGVGIGYVLGTRAGRGKFDEIKAQAQRIVTDPDVRQKVADLPNQVRENLPKAQSVVSDAVKAATDKVQSATGGGDSADSPSGSADPGSEQTGSGQTGPAGATDDIEASVITEPVVVEQVIVEPTGDPDSPRS